MFQERFNVVRHDICPLPAHVYETSYYCTCTPLDSTPLIVLDTLGRISLSSLFVTPRRTAGGLEGERERKREKEEGKGGLCEHWRENVSDERKRENRDVETGCFWQGRGEGKRGARRILASFLHFVRHAMHSSTPRVWRYVLLRPVITVVITTEFYDLIVAAGPRGFDAWVIYRKATHPHDKKRRNFKDSLEADSVHLIPSVSSSVPPQFRAQPLVRALKTLWGYISPRCSDVDRGRSSYIRCIRYRAIYLKHRY